MAHFAKIDENNKVTEIVVVNNSQEHRGQDFLAIDCGLGGTWVQTSYNGNIRGKFAGIGDTYDFVNDRFVEASPYPSWILDSNFIWNAPIVYPNNEKSYNWDEATTSWVEVN